MSGTRFDSENQVDIFQLIQTDASITLEVTNSSTRNTGSCNRSIGSCNRHTSTYTCRLQLEQDVQRLQEDLRKEILLHTVLEGAVEHTDLKLSTISGLPLNVKELLSTIFRLEITVSKLDEQMLSLHLQLDRERNDRRLLEYQYVNAHAIKHSPEDKKTLNMVDSSTVTKEKKVSTNIDRYAVVDATEDVTTKGLFDHPNQLSEVMVLCMRNIFITLANSSNVSSKSHSLDVKYSPSSLRGHPLSSSIMSSSDWSTVSSTEHGLEFDSQPVSNVLATEYACDPYKVRGKLSWEEIGNYRFADEISWMSVGKKQLEYASGALRRYRSLIEQLAKVNPIQMSCNEKLAFWINIYNALIMHAYLAYGVPRNELKHFSLMQKVAYTIGGHLVSAVAIEYGILKMKPPVYRPQMALLLALHKLKAPVEQHNFSIDAVEPLVAFALSCGMYSSPAAKVYTAINIKEELEEAQRDFIRASVGISSKGRLIIPKMLHCFAKALIADSGLAAWICGYLPPNQAAYVEQCMLKRRQCPLSSYSCSILPFDSRFRYLFLPDKIST